MAKTTNIETILAVVLAQGGQYQMERYFHNRVRLFFFQFARIFENEEKVPRIVCYTYIMVPLYSVDDFKDHKLNNFCLSLWTEKTNQRQRSKRTHHQDVNTREVNTQLTFTF